MYPRQARQNFRQQRISLLAFAELMDRYVDAIGRASRSLEEIVSFSEKHNGLYLRQKISLQEAEELELQIKIFHDSIEFSACLPLAVVPFLLSLLASLKKALLLIASIKHLLTESDIQAEVYERFQEETHLLKEICNDIVSQTKFTLDKAKFREKSIKDRL